MVQSSCFTLVSVVTVARVESAAAVEAGRRASAVFLQLLFLTISAPHCQLPTHDPAESPGRDHGKLKRKFYNHLQWDFNHF